MSKDDPTDVSTAFELLLGKIEIEINSLDKAASKASEEHDRKSAREVLERADQITAFRDKVVSLRKEWETLAGEWGDTEREEIMLAEFENSSMFSQMTQDSTEREEILLTEQRNLSRLPQEKRTPEENFYQSILQVLVESGGSARPRNVLVKLETMMRGVLKPVDYDHLRSGEIRWRKTANFARNSMANKKGLLKSNSPRGIWEITDAGRKYLAEKAH